MVKIYSNISSRIPKGLVIFPINASCDSMFLLFNQVLLSINLEYPALANKLGDCPFHLAVDWVVTFIPDGSLLPKFAQAIITAPTIATIINDIIFTFLLTSI